MNYGVVVELDDGCDDREWFSADPIASDFRGLWLHSLQLWYSTESVKTADFVQEIERAHMVATNKRTLCHGFAGSAR
eukprot:7111829-Lingulodinium_polyedra.AAC.1